MFLKRSVKMIFFDRNETCRRICLHVSSDVCSIYSLKSDNENTLAEQFHIFYNQIEFKKVEQTCGLVVQAFNSCSKYQQSLAGLID